MTIIVREIRANNDERRLLQMNNAMSAFSNSFKIALTSPKLTLLCEYATN